MAQVLPLKLNAVGGFAQFQAGDTLPPAVLGTVAANDSLFLRGDGAWAKQLNTNGANGTTVSMLVLNTGTMNATAVWSGNVVTFRNTAGILGHVGMYGDGSVAMIGLWAQDGAVPTVQVRATGEVRLGQTATSHIRFGAGAYGVGVLVNGVMDGSTCLYANTNYGSAGVSMGFYNGTTYLSRFDISVGNVFTWRNDSAMIRMLLNASGNLGVSATPSAWNTTTKALQIGPRVALASINAVATQLTNNSYYNGTNHVYLEAAAAAFYAMNVGNHQWGAAPAGAAGANITYVVGMTLDIAGRLGLGVIPSVWGADTVVMQIGAGSSFANIQAVSTSVGENVHWDGSSWKYLRTAPATNFYLQDGAFVWRSAISGTAGTNIASFPELMRLTLQGHLGLGTSTPDVNSIGSYPTFRVHGPGPQIVIHDTSATSTWAFYVRTGAATRLFRIYDYVAGADRLTISSTGVVNIPGSLTAAAFGAAGVGLVLLGNALSFSSGRALFSAVNEPYGIGVRYVSSGGPVYFGATDNTGTPGWQISAAGGGSMIQGTNAGAVSIPGLLGVGSTTTPRERVDVNGSIVTNWANCRIGMSYLDGLNFFAGLVFDAGARSVDLRSLFNDSGYITLSVGTAGGTFAERMRVDTASVRVTGPFDIQYSAGYTATRLISYQHGLSLWVLQPAGTQAIMLGEQLNYDYAVAIQYTGGTIGAGAGLLRIGQLQANTTFTHGITEMYAAGGVRLYLDSMGVRVAGRLAPNAVSQLTTAAWNWGATSYHCYAAAGGSFTSITNARDGEMKRIDVRGGGAISITVPGFVWATGHPNWGTARTLVTVIRVDATPTYVGTTIPAY